MLPFNTPAPTSRKLLSKNLATLAYKAHWQEQGSVPAPEKMRRNWRDVARAQKDSPAATAHASSPTGRPTVQSLLGAQLSNGLYITIDGASALDVLANNAP